MIGQEFELVLLERVNEQSAGTLAELMREAAEVGIVAAASRETYRFTHPLIREALYKDSTDADRARLHRAIAEALEDTHEENLTPHLASLAHHFHDSNPRSAAPSPASVTKDENSWDYPGLNGIWWDGTNGRNWLYLAFQTG